MAAVDSCAGEGAGNVPFAGLDCAGDDGEAIAAGGLAGAVAWASSVGAGVGSTRDASSDARAGPAFAVGSVRCEATRLVDAKGAGGNFATGDAFGGRAADTAVEFNGIRLPG